LAQTIIQIEGIINDNANRYSNFVIVLIISKDYQKAITYINKGLALTPNHDYLTFNKALTYYLMKDYQNADIRYSNLRKDYKPEEAKIIFADYLMTQ
jgi:tetratricopeptide (TPR) repeat protein